MQTENSEKDMSIIEHLEELRWHLMRIVIALMLGALIIYIFNEFFFDKVLFGPLHGDFITYKYICQLSHKFHAGDDFCFSDLNFKLQNTAAGGQFNVFIQGLFILGFILVFPYIFYEIWSFIKPALKDKEIKAARGLIFWCTLLFFAGVFFGYFIMVPFSMQFISSFSISDVVKNDINIDSYFETIAELVLGSGLVFQMPIIVYFLTKLGIVTPGFLAKHRKYSIIIILIIAAIITPPDIISQMIISLPLFLLYEVSIIVSLKIIKQQPHEY